MKLRDTQKWTFLSSYYIKTIFLWEVENQNYLPDFWNKSLGFLFLHMLQELQTCLKNKKIEFFWHRGFNLLDAIKPSCIECAYCRLNNIIMDLNKTPKDATLVQKYLVTEEDRERIRKLNPAKNSEINVGDSERRTCQIPIQAEALAENKEAAGYKCTLQ